MDVPGESGYATVSLNVQPRDWSRYNHQESDHF